MKYKPATCNLQIATAATTADEFYMKIALEQAQEACEKGEVPVGACVVHEEKVIARSYNQPISLNDPTAHAEILSLRQAARILDNYRLTDCSLYVTIEPCLMCTGAMLYGRIDRLVFGALDPKGGAICSRYHLNEDRGLDYPLKITQGVLKKECAEIIQRFFRKKRSGSDKSSFTYEGGEVPKWP